MKAPPEPLELYRWATQDPATQAAVLAAIYRRLRADREPLCLREDFAGNAADSVAWVDAGCDRRAVAVDLDPPTVAHAVARARRLLGPRADRIAFHVADVHALQPPAVAAADVLSVLNFSIGYFHQRDALCRYLRHARRALAADGVLVLNCFGGADAMAARIDRHTIEPGREAGSKPLPVFDYLWEQRRFDALRARLECRIHFELPDPAAVGGVRRIADAFRYEWRLWTLPELLEAMREAGFRRAQVWRHTARRKRNGQWNVSLGPVRRLPERRSWVAYVVGG